MHVRALILLTSLTTLPATACVIITDDVGDADETAGNDNPTTDTATSEATTSTDTAETGPGETSTDTAETSPGETSTDTAETSPGETSVGETSVGETTSDTSDTTGGGTLAWYTTCGDPVCQGYEGPWEGIPTCPDINEGDPCDTEGAQCDFMSDCNATFICATEDPKMQEGGCPISRAAFKQDIDYLDDAQRDAFYQQVLDMRLATWRYRDRADGKQSVGVILEDGEDRIWADPANDRVDLYSYGSLALVGVQAQADELAELRAAVAALQGEVVELREQAAHCK